MSTLPTDSAERKAIPLARGVLDYFPSALAEVARVSKAGNDKHNPGEPMHHARGKSTDHADSILRHLTERGGIDPDTGLRHSAELAWRALALLQEELEDAGAPLARGAVLPGDEDFDAWLKHDDSYSHDGISPMAGTAHIHVQTRSMDEHDDEVELRLIDRLERSGRFSPDTVRIMREEAGQDV